MGEFRGIPAIFERYTSRIKNNCEGLLLAQTALENALNAHLPYWNDNTARDAAIAILTVSESNKILYNKAKEKLDYAVKYYNAFLKSEMSDRRFVCQIEHPYVIRISEGEIAKMSKDITDRSVVVNLNTMGDFIVKLKGYIHKTRENKEHLAQSCNGWEASFEETLEGEIQTVSRNLEEGLRSLESLARALDKAYDELMWIDIMGGKA